MIETIQADWIKSEAINLENCCNDNPLKILGPHFYAEQWVIRVWMPEADEVKINFKNNTYKAENINHKWLFEAIVPEDPNSDYEVNVSRGGVTHTQRHTQTHPYTYTVESCAPPLLSERVLKIERHTSLADSCWTDF